ncbi:MAG: hypothetical protein HQK57_02665 [Deltaproteobacteria bacterium]|nr:hypothetical protein [Deltaproteobacteria bacterium]
MITLKTIPVVEKLKIGIPGFDQISHGGLPKDRTTLVSGTSGSAKTVFAVQFLASGIQQADQHGVFVTFEESPRDICQNMLGFNWNIQEWEKQGKWAFVDASPQVGEETIVAGKFDLGALLARIKHAVQKVNASRISLDSLGAIFTKFNDSNTIRRELFRIATALKAMGLTAIMTAERTQEYGEVSRFGVEEFVADNVIVLRNVLDEENRRRTMEVLRFRGTSHQKGEMPFTIVPGHGIIMIPLSAIEIKQTSSSTRVTSGSPELDRMCGGAFIAIQFSSYPGPPAPVRR